MLIDYDLFSNNLRKKLATFFQINKKLDVSKILNFLFLKYKIKNER